MGMRPSEQRYMTLRADNPHPAATSLVLNRFKGASCFRLPMPITNQGVFQFTETVIAFNMKHSATNVKSVNHFEIRGTGWFTSEHSLPPYEEQAGRDGDHQKTEIAKRQDCLAVRFPGHQRKAEIEAVCQAQGGGRFSCQSPGSSSGRYLSARCKHGHSK